MKKINKYIFVLDILSALLLVGFLFFVFIHNDLNTVGLDSQNYVMGKFLDFYDFNNKNSKNYLPSTYVIFATWNTIYIKIFNFGFSDSSMLDGRVFWYKLEMILFGMGCGFVIYKIICSLTNKKKTSTIGVIHWLTSPMVIFCLFIFTQSDILTCFFLLLGIYFYLEKKLYKFCFFFGIATTFKYFPFLIFIPLLLLVEKNILKVAKYLFLFSLPFIFETYLYIESSVFKKNVLGWGVANDKLLGPLLINSTPYVHVYLIVFSLICAMAYSLKINQNKNIINRLVFYIPLFVLSFIFIFIDWYPQWFLLITPFMTLTTLQSPPKKIYFYVVLEIIMYYFYVAYIVHYFSYHIDQKLLGFGVFKMYNLLELNQNTMKDFFYPMTPTWSYTMVSACLFIQLIFKFPLDLFINNVDRDYPIYKIDLNTIRFRFYWGVFIWLIPALICLNKPNPVKIGLLLISFPLVQLGLIGYKGWLDSKHYTI